MQKHLIALLIMISASATGATLDREDYKNIKDSIIKVSSEAMLQNSYIKESLNIDDFFEINVATDILQDKNIATVKTVIMPSEENCNCQDVFETSMEVEKVDKSWKVVKASVLVVHFPTDQ